MKFSLLTPFVLAGANAMLIPALEKSLVSKRNSSDDQVGWATVLPTESDRVDHSDDGTPRQYIVVLESGQDEQDYDAHDQWVSEQVAVLRKRGEVDDTLSVLFFNVSSFQGYVGSFTPDLLETIKEDPLVSFVEEDQVVEGYKVVTQQDAPWGLGRLSQRNKANPASKRHIYDDAGGKGVTAYVIDSGINTDQSEFEGRALWGLALLSGGARNDAHGHGSHVAGTIGGRTYGVAKKVNLVAVSVLDKDNRGWYSDFIKGIEFAVKDHQKKVRERRAGYRGATMNLSLGGGPSNALDNAINAAANAGVHVVVSAGNNNDDACKYSPARASGAITVGATDINDRKASFSNYGLCVDIQAPGVNVLSVGFRLPTAWMSGTSMAAPHVAGLLSYFLSLQPGLGSEFSADNLIKPADLKRKLIRFGTKNVISGLDSASPNVLVFNGAGRSLADLWRL